MKKQILYPISAVLFIGGMVSYFVKVNWLNAIAFWLVTIAFLAYFIGSLLKK